MPRHWPLVRFNGVLPTSAHPTLLRIQATLCLSLAFVFIALAFNVRPISRLPISVRKFRVQCTGMCISVLISRGEQYIANAHTWMCGLDFKRSMECVAQKRIKTALNLRTLFGNPEGVNGMGPDFFGDPCFYVLGCRLTKSYPPSEGEIKLAASGANTVNTPH